MRSLQSPWVKLTQGKSQRRAACGGGLQYWAWVLSHAAQAFWCSGVEISESKQEVPNCTKYIVTLRVLFSDPFYHNYQPQLGLVFIKNSLGGSSC